MHVYSGRAVTKVKGPINIRAIHGSDEMGRTSAMAGIDMWSVLLGASRFTVIGQFWMIEYTVERDSRVGRARERGAWV